MKSSTLVSVITPTWNRAQYLRSVFLGLSRQTHRTIEWLVGDDGSTDGTDTVIEQIASEAWFPITYFKSSVRVGKAVVDNQLVSRARGEFVIWNDSDDCLTPGAIEELLAEWDSIPAAEREEFVAVTALCQSLDGAMQSAVPVPGDYFWRQLNETHGSGDRTHLMLRSAVGERPFQEVDFVIPESSAFSHLATRKVRFTTKVLKIVNRATPNRISFSGKMQYSRGRAYAMVDKSRRDADDAWRIITFHRYCIHGDMGVRRAQSIWGTPRLRWWLLYPVGAALALKDQLQGKVEKTHREFEKNRAIAIFTTKTFSKNPATTV